VSVPRAGRRRPYRCRIARVIRSQLPDGGFHVTVRGVKAHAIVRTSHDAHKLLTLIREARAAVDTRAYCVLPNHFHLVVVATARDLARAMKRINGVYAQWFNRKYGGFGHVFQGRYGAKPIRTERHLYETIRYVLLNPVRAGLCEHPGEWPWSNYADVAQDPELRAMIDVALVELQKGQGSLRGTDP
jgi:putative transposase